MICNIKEKVAECNLITCVIVIKDSIAIMVSCSDDAICISWFSTLAEGASMKAIGVIIVLVLLTLNFEEVNSVKKW